MAPETPFDPNAAAPADSGLFGLDIDESAAGVTVIPVPWDATASYRKGAASGPEAILRASHQVDLFDLTTGRPFEAGIHMLPIDGSLAAANREARKLCEGLEGSTTTFAGTEARERAHARVDELSRLVNTHAREQTLRTLDRGKLPILLGGDHSSPFGAIEAAAGRHPGLGILHIDAHADLREAYGGFTWSHASILYNVLTRLEDVRHVVQVGVRDLCEAEFDLIEAFASRLTPIFDRDWARQRLSGASLAEVVRRAIEPLPERVWITLDIDGLDPSLCPNTGTPVPGGLDWNELCLWLDILVESGRRIVGADLCEVSPGAAWDPADDRAPDTWDAMVGARTLYRLIGSALQSQR